MADSALSTRLSSPRMLRATWRASSSSSDALAPIRPRNAVIDSALFQVTTPRPRRTRHDAGSPTSSSRPASSPASATGTTNSRCACPLARLSEPRARYRPRSQANRQCSAACAQSNGSSGRENERRTPPPSSAWPPSRTTSRATAGSRVRTRGPRPAISARRSHGREGSTAESSARSAATRSRSDPDIGSRSGRPVGARRACRAGSPAMPALAAPRRGSARPRDARSRGGGRWRDRRGRRGRAAARARRWAATAGARARRASPSARARRTGCWRGRCPPGGRRRAARARRRGSRGRTRRSRRAASPRCTRTRPAPRTPRSPRGSRAPRARAGCW